MNFTFETKYDKEAVKTMAEVLRKTIRKKRSLKSHIFGWIIIIIAILLTIPTGDEEFVLTFNNIITWIATLAILIVLLFEDRLNGYIARKRMLTGVEQSTAVFDEEKYVSTTKMGKTEWDYKNIGMVVEIRHYFVFLFDKYHAQVYDKNNLTGGTAEEFREFITKRTEKEVWQMK